MTPSTSDGDVNGDQERHGSMKIYVEIPSCKMSDKEIIMITEMSMTMTMMTRNKRPLLVKILGDTIQPGQIYDSQTKTCQTKYKLQ